MKLAFHFNFNFLSIYYAFASAVTDAFSSTLTESPSVSFFTFTWSSATASFEIVPSKLPASFASNSSLDGSFASVIISSTVFTSPSIIPPLIL